MSTRHTRPPASPEDRPALLFRGWVWMAALVVLYFFSSRSELGYWDEYFYLFSVSEHTIGNLLKMEPVLSELLFPGAFFSAKIGFVLFLDRLVDFFGVGGGGIGGIRTVFVLLGIGFAFSQYVVIREILGRRFALGAMAVALLAPVTVYLGGKVLSEIPSAILASLAAWAFLASFRPGLSGRAVAGWLLGFSPGFSWPLPP